MEDIEWPVVPGGADTMYRYGFNRESYYQYTIGRKTQEILAKCIADRVGLTRPTSTRMTTAFSLAGN